MVLPEYANLTTRELEMADHYAEIGDMARLREYQRLSATRGNGQLNTKTYAQPMRPQRIFDDYNW